MRSSFLLEKWYMDVVSDDATAAIGYFSILRWKKFSLTYSGLILRNKQGEVAIKNSFKNISSPLWSGTQLQWNTEFLKSGWSAISPPIQIDLLKNKNQFIEWNCFMPKGHGKAIIGDTSVEGLGYAEKMTLNIAPWQLPIKELFWGRFLSSDYSIIWIEWRGPQPKLLIWVNAELENNGTISNDGIQVGKMKLIFQTKFELRSGNIGETIFKGIRKVLSIFPASIFQLHEKKWCGVANLTTNGQQFTGTYIHEHVIWQ